MPELPTAEDIHKMENAQIFFKKKNSWSKYKDLILDYYLSPYLNKIATLEKRIVVIDCFAGPGRFDDGELGSPLIIANNILPLYQRGVPVSALCIEQNEDLFTKLQRNTINLGVPIEVRQGCFRDYLGEIAHLARTHTVFLYIDPFKPSDILFDDLIAVYDCLKSGQSVETLINFMSTSFMRAIWSLKKQITASAHIQANNRHAVRWNQIAGGPYWQDFAFDETLSSKERIDRLATGYADQLHRWFKWVLTYPIREDYNHESPKYHLVFGSRSTHAVDLMNRAMVKARREFVGAQFVKDMLFENQPKKEVVDPDEIKQLILQTSQTMGKQQWNILRAHATINHPCMYNDSELNRAIKKAIQEGSLVSDCAGTKIDEHALVWSPPEVS